MREEKVGDGEARRWRGWWLGIEDVELDPEDILKLSNGVQATVRVFEWAESKTNVIPESTEHF